MSVIEKYWNKIFECENIHSHNFDKEPYIISTETIKKYYKELRKIVYIDKEKNRPEIFKKYGIDIFPLKNNGNYALAKTYNNANIDLPDIKEKNISFKLPDYLKDMFFGTGEITSLDMLFASGAFEDFTKEKNLQTVIRGRKYSSGGFDIKIGGKLIRVDSVQFEVDTGYANKNSVCLCETKNDIKDINLRQIYYPYMYVRSKTNKNIRNFVITKGIRIYEIVFENDDILNPIIIKMEKFSIK